MSLFQVNPASRFYKLAKRVQRQPAPELHWKKLIETFPAFYHNQSALRIQNSENIFLAAGSEPAQVYQSQLTKIKSDPYFLRLRLNAPIRKHLLKHDKAFLEYKGACEQFEFYYASYFGEENIRKLYWKQDRLYIDLYQESKIKASVKYSQLIRHKTK